MGAGSFAVYWTDSARDDLIEVIEYISADNPGEAEKIFNSIKKQAEKLNSFPHRGRIVPELYANNMEQYRELVTAPWRIIYRIEEKRVYVLAVFDGRRNIEDVLLKRLTRE